MSDGKGTGVKVTDRRLFLADGSRNTDIPEAEQTIKPSDKTNGNGGMGRAMALDTFRNAVARMGAGTASIPEATEYVMERISLNFWLLLTMYRNSFLARKIVDIPSEDMTKNWCKIASEVSPDDIKRFDTLIESTGTSSGIEQAIKWSRLYGGAGCLICIKGHEDHLDKPLDVDDVEPHSYQGLIPFDRWVGITPIGEISSSFNLPMDFGLPEMYSVQSAVGGQSFYIHSSRILRFLGPEVPKPEFQAQQYWGISVLEPAFEAIRMFDNSLWSMLQLLFRAQILAQRNKDLTELMSGLGMSENASQMFYGRMEAQNQLLSNQSMMILPEDGELFATQYSFSGLDGVIDKFMLVAAGAAEIPMTRLFGKSIGGLGQTNDADERYYEEKIAHDQVSRLKPQLMKLYPIIAASCWGEVPDDLAIKFPSVRVMTNQEKADMADKGSAPVIATYNAGMISQQTAGKELKELSETTGIFTNLTNEDIEKMETEIQMPGEMGMGSMGEEEPGEAGESGKGGNEKEKGPGENTGLFAKPNPRKELRQLAGGAMDERKLAKRLTWHGLDVSIENPAGSVRRGTDHDGNPWEVTLTYDYGYLLGTRGVDGDHVYVFMGSDRRAEKVYVVHTLRAPKFTEFDEDKCFVDFSSEWEARTAFFSNYDRPEHFGSMETLSVGDFIDKVLATKKIPKAITAAGD
jgi:phage-related protein (TIGR01555 family)